MKIRQQFNLFDLALELLSYSDYKFNYLIPELNYIHCINTCISIKFDRGCVNKSKDHSQIYLRKMYF